MNHDAMRLFLIGQFSTWLATWAGRDKPNKDDKARAAIAADAALRLLVTPEQGTLL